MKKILLAVPLLGLLSFIILKSSSSEAPVPSGVGQWADFGKYKIGDSIIYLWGNGKWKSGVVMELGKPYNAAAKNSDAVELKYKIAEYTGWPDWKDFSQVVSKEREPWWTSFFTGQWNLGEVMAVNTRVKGDYEQTEFGYHKATETLKVTAVGRYTWKTADGKTVSGNWFPLADGPGIVLKKAYKGMSWTFINQTNATTMHIRKLENGRLFPDGTEMSKAATRPLK